jgi:hypothetical protein
MKETMVMSFVRAIFGKRNDQMIHAKCNFKYKWCILRSFRMPGEEQKLNM